MVVDEPITKSGFLSLVCTGEGVVGLGLRLGVRLGLGLGYCLGRTGEGEGEGEGEDEALEKKAVIWLCWFTSGDLPLLRRRVGAIEEKQIQGETKSKSG